MNEKVGSKYIKYGTISMQGGLRTAEYEEVESQLELSSAKEEFMNGVLDIIIGHAESWLSDVAKSILDSLQQKGKNCIQLRSSQSISGEFGLIHCMYEIEHVKYVEEGLFIRNQRIN